MTRRLAESVVTLSADFLCAMVACGDSKFRAVDEALQAEKRAREAKAKPAAPQPPRSRP